MRIEIDLSAADDPDGHRWLDLILQKFEDGWHVWDTSSETDPEAIIATTWIRSDGRQGARVRELLRASIKRTAWSSPAGRRVRVTTSPMEADELRPRDAALLAEEPLVILVENRRSDGPFIERVVMELDKSLYSLWRRRGDPIRFDSLGGKGEMPDEVERQAQAKPYRPRLVAVIDSDRKGPEDPVSRNARRLRRKCDRWEVPCWVLAKREAENYLPGVLLREREDASADHLRRVEAWDRLNDDQKDYYDMKDGLPEILSENERVLFGALSPSDREVLSSGFGARVYKCWSIWSVRANTGLNRRGRGDLQHGIELIRGEA